MRLTEARRFNGIELSLIRQIMAKAAPGAVNMALGELRFPMPAAMKAYAAELILKEESFYSPNAGLPILRESIAASYGQNVSPDSICVTNGAEEAIFLSLFALTNPGEKIAIPDPDYTAYPAIAKILDLETVPLSFEADLKSINWDLWDKLLSMNVKYLLFSNPQNPSGYYHDHASLCRLAEICSRYGITVIVDEIYRELAFAEPLPALDSYFEDLIQIGGLSKSHLMSGWRLGWVKSPTTLSPTIIKARQYVSTCSAYIAQKLGIYALGLEGDKVLTEVRQRLSECRSYTKNRLLQSLSPERLFYPSASPYIMLKTDDLSFATRLASMGVIVVPGSAFGKVSQDFIRINCALPQTELSQALDILCDAL